MQTLFVDVETRSQALLKSCGVYRYAEESEILLLGYAYDDEQVTVLDLVNGPLIPKNLTLDINDPEILKIAHNANFERVILSNHLGRTMPPEQWICTAAWASAAGLPKGLEKACAMAGIEGKLAGGNKLMSKFCVKNMPCDGVDWENFKEYNRQDVQAERDLYHWLYKRFPMLPREWEYWYADQAINDRGFMIDLPFVKKAVKLLQIQSDLLMAEARKISGIENPNSPAQLKAFLGVVGSLDKEAVMERLKTATGVEKRLLEIRQRLGMTSVKKYQALLKSVCEDDRVRGTLLFNGAHTGRWSGKIFQPQNLPRLKCIDPEFARKLVMSENVDDVELFYGDVETLLSSMVRSAIRAPDNGFLRVDDFAQIEARVIAWLAGEKWMLECFRTGKPYYETTASRMFHIPLENITKELRQKGKTASLALQYQGKIGALKQMGADNYMTEQEMGVLADTWRNACPAICKLWENLNNAAVSAVRCHTDIKVDKVKFRFNHGAMMIELPSGRSIVYQKATIGVDAWGFSNVRYINEKGEQELYGGVIAENIVQGIARDILAEQIMACKDFCIMHVHDEVVSENKTIPMIKLPDWCSDLPLEMAGFETFYYRKD